ncbi:CIC11C00000003948 [Sungouiella intermedia]|uniref:Acyl-coenzyme A oxidase n=1 Tax=Sungouiella intermedia TaxID=45354 RepID=A0A1L0BFQ5_9ASCO|nr:CIC11C00000003948 [[Candida] intermedia]SGZ58767.1 CIC11C00000003806 [[Candida] intermedia]
MSYPYSKVEGTVSFEEGPKPKNAIQREREAATFDLDEMNYFLEGSKETALETRGFMSQFERDPILAASPKDYDASKPEHRQITIQKIDRLSRYIEVDTFDALERRMNLLSVFDPSFHTRLGVHLGLFLGCVRGNGTPEQMQYWLLTKEAAYVKHIYGCFGMTELAHGSNVAGLQTTATYDEENEQFIINTPNLGATKWWIGGAAHSATHCSVYARLIVKGKDYGVKTFIVPLRDSDHNLMPGIAIGDIGAKMGRDGIDNGWIQFSNVKIPRYFMLQKYCKVSADGEVTEPPLNQLSYSALLLGRVTMVKDAFRWAARVVTIAIRYGVGRTQFKAALAKESDPESQLLNYPLHQRRLIPLLAMTYAFSNGANVLQETLTTTMDELDKAVAADDKSKLDASVEEMKSLFIASGSLKSTCTWLTLNTIDQCRQACGGHGYSAYSGFGKAFNDFAVQCTWEGDNNILGMSVGKQLLKKFAAIKKGEEATGILDFLGNYKKLAGTTPVLETNDLKDPRKILLAIETALVRACIRADAVLEEKKGDTDYIGADLVTLSKLLAHFFLLKAFLDKIDASKDKKDLLPLLDLLAQLYGAVVVLEGFSGTFLTFSVVSTDAMAKNSTEHIADLCAELRPHVIPLTDSFMMSDMMINAPIGYYNGDIYENYFRVVNQNNPPKNTKAPYSSELEAMLGRSSLAERQRFEREDETEEILSG